VQSFANASRDKISSNKLIIVVRPADVEKFYINLFEVRDLSKPEPARVGLLVTTCLVQTGSIRISLVWFGRGLPCARMIEIDRWKRLPESLTFLADRAIFRGLGGSVEPALDGAYLEGPPVSEGAP
jgi:hypothetical protein